MPSWTAERDSRSRKTRGWRTHLQHVRSYLLRPFQPDMSFITFHYLYFVGTCLIASIVFYGSSTPRKSVRYVDCVFLVVSAITGAGLNTVNLSQLNTFQQFILFLLIMMGSAIFVSFAIIEIRKNAFKTKLQEFAERRRGRISDSSSAEQPLKRSRLEKVGATAATVRSRAIHEPVPARSHVPSFRQSELRDGQPHSSRNLTLDHANCFYQRSSEHISPEPGVEQYDAAAHPWHSGPRLEDQEAVDEQSGQGAGKNTPDPQGKANNKLNKYISTVNGYLGRNSQVYSLTKKEQRELGGIEYDALRILSYVVPLYFILFQLFGAVGCGLWMHFYQPRIAKDLNPFWRGAFLAVSAFNNSGMALLDANVTVLQESYYMLLTLSLLIVAGKTGFPPFLRLIIWTMKCCMPDQPRWQKVRLTLQFILDHPRRVYTNLFPADATWWLALSVVVLNGIDWLVFEVLNIGNPVVEAIPPRFRALDGLFQAFAIRSGGFHVVNLSQLYPGTLVMYVIMMYLNAFPVTMTIRTTNVYEEQSLGIFPGDPMPSAADNSNVTARGNNKRGKLSVRNASVNDETAQLAKPRWQRRGFVRQQIISQLGHDLWWLAIAVFFIVVVETGQFLRDPLTFSVLNIVFEVISGYGTVGVTTGVPWDQYSLSGAFHTCSKLILCAVMLRGRHRELPVAIDRAVLLPDQALWWADEDDSHTRRGSVNSTTALFRNTTPSSPDEATGSDPV